MLFKENIGNLSLLNGNIVSSGELEHYSENDYTVFYEVIRIIDRVPLFYEDHYARLKNSMLLVKKELAISKKDLRDQITSICDRNTFQNCNVKVLVLQNDTEQNVILFINKFYYPTKQEYDNGVRCCLANIKRSNPNIKMINTNYKEMVNKVMQEKNCFEVLLVDNNRITEGSKSNSFFVKGNKIYTSPGEYVLKGVTRQYIISVCTKLGYEVIETLIGPDTLKSIDAAFISGTSINALPVSEIDDLKLNSAENQVVQHVMQSYKELIDDYIKRNM